MYKKIQSFLILLVAVFLPLIFLFHIETVEFLKYPWFPNQGYWFDWFLYGKSMFVQIVAVIMTAILIRRKGKKKQSDIKIEKVCLGIMVVFLVISTIFSKYPEQSVKGSLEQYESLGVLLSYLIIGVFCSKYVEDGNIAQLVAKALVAGLGISCIFGIFQVIQMDLWNTELGRSLLIPNEFADLRESIRFSEDSAGMGRTYMAMYNPNYAGIYIVMLLPFLFLLKNKLCKVLLIPALLCLAATGAKTAWIAAAAIGVVGYWIYLGRRDGKKLSKTLLLAGVGVFFVVVALEVLIPTKDGVLMEGNKLQAVVPEEEYIRIVYNDNTLYFGEFPKDDGVTYRIVDEEGREPDLVWVEERGEMDSLDPRFQELHFKVYKKDGIGYAVFRYEDVVFRFTDQLGTGKYEYISINGKQDMLRDAATVVDAGDGFLNGRGYIWNRVLPIMAENLLFGTGPDTFLQVFPQNDYVARANLGYGFFAEILTNAHSFYLQIGLQNGLIVLICLLLLVGCYIKKSWKLYAYKETYSEMDRIGLACFLGCLGYLLCGITFASSVCTTPIFTILLGVGMAIQKNNYENL